MNALVGWAATVGMFVFALGLWIGGAVRNHAWAENADHPARMLHRGKFYRVIRQPKP